MDRISRLACWGTAFEMVAVGDVTFVFALAAFLAVWRIGGGPGMVPA